MIHIHIATKLAVGFALATGLLATAVPAMAAAAVPGHNPMQNLVAAIASKFNLKEADVQQVVDSVKETNQADRQDQAKTRLDVAVSKGTITQAQEELIVQKQADEQTFRASLKDKTPTERQAAVAQDRADTEAWAKANNIPRKFVAPAGRGNMMRSMHQ